MVCIHKGRLNNCNVVETVKQADFQIVESEYSASQLMFWRNRKKK